MSIVNRRNALVGWIVLKAGKKAAKKKAQGAVPNARAGGVAAGATLGLQSVLGFVGTGLAIAAFVVFANPASGGPLPKVLLPEPWRSVGPYLPTGAGTDALRDVFYFGGHGVLVPLLLLAGYAVAGCALVAALGAAAARRAAV